MLTEEIIKPFLAKDKKDIPYSKFKKEADEIAEVLEIHACGEYPYKLIDETARPNELPIYKDYRRAVYEPVTKTYWEKSSNVVKKINQAEGFKIDFPEQKGISKNKATLQDYILESFPFFDSLTNWTFSFFVDRMLADPNSVLAVLPLPKNNPLDDTELVRPYPFFYESDDIYYYEENVLFVAEQEEKSRVKKGDNYVNEGKILIAVDNESYSIITQIGKLEDNTFNIEIFPFLVVDKEGNKYMPCVQSGGVIKEFTIKERLHESFFQGCVPMFNEAVRRYSDHQVNMVLHLHPDRWEIQDTECKVCKGKGTIQKMSSTKQPYDVACNTCGGTGMITNKTPFGNKLIKVAQKTGMNDSVSVPIPPMGYINRDIKSIEYLKQEYKQDIQDGLAAFNFEWLMQEPAVNSGIAKMYDRQELNGFLSIIANHLGSNIINPIIFFINELRYGYQGAIRFDNLPTVQIPSEFDVVYADALMSNIKTAKDAGAPSSMLNQLYISLSQKEFGKNSPQHKVNELTLQLDPMPNKTSDEKVLEMSSGACTKTQFIVSCQITSLINEAIQTVPNFLDLQYIEQKRIIYALAESINTQNTASLIPIVGNAGQTI